MSLSINEIHNQSCRDLWWAMHSAPLLQQHNSMSHHVTSIHDPLMRHILKKGHAGFLQVLTQPERLERYLSERPQQRLGHYFEDLVNFWILHLSELQGHSHIQFNENKRTLGECDLIFEYEHQWQWWEMAVKFYCLDQDPMQASHWRGINSNDSLARKSEHMMQQQLMLCQHPFVIDHLHHKNITGDIHTAAFFKGYLFTPVGNDQPTHKALTINNTVAHGWLLRDHQAELLPRSRASARYIRIPQMQWLAPALRKPKANDLLSWQEMRSNIDKKVYNGECMLAEMIPQADGYWAEHSRGCIIAEDWPCTPY